MQLAQQNVMNFEPTLADARAHLQESQAIQNNVMLQVSLLCCCLHGCSSAPFLLPCESTMHQLHFQVSCELCLYQHSIFIQAFDRCCICQLQVYQGYLSLLADASLDGSAADNDVPMEDNIVYSVQDSQKAWRTRTLAALGAFLRKHYLSIAHVASEIEQGVTEGVSSDIKETVLRNLYL